jgi:hypothetical protein
MSMMDFAGALGADAGAPPGGQPPPGGPPPDDTAGGGEQFTNSLDALDAAEEALHAFIQLDPDEPDRAQGAQALQIVLKLKAANQTSAQSGDMKSLQRALATAGPPGAAGPLAGPPVAAGY